MADIFREVDEELRQERAARLWKQYGHYLIAAAVIVVLAVGGHRLWREHERTTAEARSERYEQAVQRAASGGADAAMTDLAALGEDGGAGYGSLAQLHRAALAREQGDVEGALLVYDALANAEATPALFRDLAVLLAARLRLDRGEAERVQAALDPLIAGDGPWRVLAVETMAALALRRGESGRARTLLAEIADDPDAPARARGRAAELLQALPR